MERVMINRHEISKQRRGRASAYDGTNEVDRGLFQSALVEADCMSCGGTYRLADWGAFGYSSNLARGNWNVDGRDIVSSRYDYMQKVWIHYVFQCYLAWIAQAGQRRNAEARWLEGAGLLRNKIYQKRRRRHWFHLATSPLSQQCMRAEQ